MEAITPSVQQNESTPLRNGVEATEPSSDELTSLPELVREIEAHAGKSDERMLKAATMLRELRLRVEQGEAGEGVKWLEWANKTIKLSPSQLFLLNAIAEADDPKKALERQRKLTCERVKEHREKKRAQERALEPERREFREWVKDAPIEEVRTLLEQARRMKHNREIMAASPVAESASDAVDGK